MLTVNLFLVSCGLVTGFVVFIAAPAVPDKRLPFGFKQTMFIHVHGIGAQSLFKLSCFQRASKLWND